MGKNTGFMEYEREVPGRRLPAERINDWFEIYAPFPEDKTRTQGARCMDCGVPVCHTGCHLTNIIPDFNDLVYQRPLERGLTALSSTPPTISPNSRGASARRRAKPPASWASTNRRSLSRSSSGLSSIAPLTKAGCIPSLPRCARVNGSRWSAPGPRVWRPRNSSATRRPLGHRLRESRSHRRRTPALRHPQFQNGEAP